MPVPKDHVNKRDSNSNCFCSNPDPGAASYREIKSEIPERNSGLQVKSLEKKGMIME